MLWQTYPSSTPFALCNLVELPEGILVSPDPMTEVHYILRASYQQLCYRGLEPMKGTKVNIVLNKLSEPLPIVRESWRQFVNGPYNLRFINNFVPVIFSISVLAIITWFLTIFVITNYTIKPSLLLRISTIFSLIYMVALISKSIMILHGQQKIGYLHGQLFLSDVNKLLWLNVIDLIVTLLLQTNQVQVIMRLFLRQSDKRLIFLAGISACIVSQVLWALTKFSNFSSVYEAQRLIPVLTYLTRIAMSLVYATIFTAFVLTRIPTLVAHKSIWAITFLSLILIYSPVAFFIADVTSIWAYELSEVFSVVTYVVCVVIPWEWCNKFNYIRRIEENEGILGRKLYEDELYQLERFALFVEEESDSEEFPPDHPRDSSVSTESTHPSNPTPADRMETSANYQASSPRGTTESCSMSDKSDKLVSTRFNRENNRSYKVTFSQRFESFKTTFLQATDKIIATSMEIPSSVSVSSNFMRNQPLTNLQYEEAATGRSGDLQTGQRAPDSEHRSHRSRRDVFVYLTKDVVISFDSESTST